MPMCSAFHSAGPRKASQKSWLVAASTSRISRAAMPKGMNGKPRNWPNAASAPSNASNAGVGLKAKYQPSTCTAWPSATAQVITPKWRRLYSSGNARGSRRASGPMHSTSVINRNAQLPYAFIASVGASIGRTAAKCSPPHW